MVGHYSISIKDEPALAALVAQHWKSGGSMTVLKAIEILSRAVVEYEEQAGVGYQKSAGERMRKLRLQRKWTLRQASDVAGVSSSLISQAEQGNTSVSLGSLCKIATALGVKPGYLLDGEKR